MQNQNQTIGYRLSPQQARVWVLAQRSQTYRAQCAILIEGGLKADKLRAALSAVVNRHGILRTTFHRAAGLRLPVQVVADQGVVAWSEADLTDQPADKLDRTLNTVLREDEDRPCDYTTGPLVRGRLIAISEYKHVLVVTLPALCADTSTLGTLFREIARCYGSADTPEQPSDEEVEYIQFSEWQLELLEGDASVEGRHYWLNQSTASPITVNLPFENKPDKKKTFQLRSFQFAFDEETRKAMPAITERYDCSASAFLLASFQTLLWRLTGQPEISIKRMIDGRKYEELRDVMGLFGKWIPIRCLFRDDAAFSRIVKTIEGGTKEAGIWHEYFVPEASGTGDDHDGSIGFEFEDRLSRITADGVAFSIYRQQACFEPFKIKLSCYSQGDSHFAEFHYDPDLFHDDYIEALSRYFQTLIKNAAKNPRALVGDLEILSDSERRRVIEEWNSASETRKEATCLHELFEEQAEENSDRVAVEYESEALTYAGLNAKANQRARHLRALGAGAETLVGIYLERGPELLVTLLGVLKAGAAYVPVDPSYPSDRIAFMLSDANVKVLITQESLAANVDGAVEQTIIVEALQRPADHDHWNLGAASEPDNAAYVIYTSGSTGKPKGVLVTHRNVVSLFDAAREHYSFDETDVWTLFHSCAFDFSVWEIWGALLYGARLVVVPYWVSRDPAAFYSLLSSQGVTVLNQTPSAFRQLIAAAETQAAKDRLVLKNVIFGGEALDPQLLKPWFDRNGDVEPALVNMYGITETTVHVTHHPLSASETDGGSTIGRAIHNWQVYLLNSAMRLAPPGVSGEIYVAGGGITRGYLNHPDLTADRFRPDPFGGAAGARMYKSGDLGKYQRDGGIEYLGRIDHQVKIRGFRIELGEIEAIIRLHPSVREAVVIAREDEAGHKRLVAYVVPAEPAGLDLDELHSLASSKLPDYMTPGHFIKLERLPLTANGKLDRQALPAPEQEIDKLDASFVEPRNELEATLSKIWSQVLGVEHVGIHDNFFKLGGDSIISIQIIARATQAGIRLTPKQFFDHQTIAELAAVAGTASTINSLQGAVTGSVPLTPIQHWFFEQRLPDPDHFNQSLILELKERLDPGALNQAAARLLEHHDALRMRFAEEGGRWTQENLESETNTIFGVLDLAEIDPGRQKEAIEQAAADAQKSLDLREGPLVRVFTINLGERGSRLLLVIHHLVVDGVSWRILLQDLTRAYEQTVEHQTVDLGAKTTSYKEWAEALIEYAASDEIKSERSIWEEKTWNTLDALPVDYTQGDNNVGSGRVVTVSLSEVNTRELLTSVCEAYRTQIQEVLACAIGIGVSNWTGKEKVKLVMEGHGREDVIEGLDLTRTVGWFTSVYPAVIELKSGQGWEEKLRSVKEELRSAPAKGIGYGILKYLTPEGELSDPGGELSDPGGELSEMKRSSEGEIIFNYLGQLDEVLTETRFQSSSELPGPNRSLDGKRKYAIDISASVTEGRMYLHWTYSTNLHRRETIKRVAEDCREALQELIDHSRSEGAGDYTPSDFPLAQLDQQALDKALLEVEF